MPYLPPRANLIISMISVGVDIANCLARREDKGRAGQEKTRGGLRPSHRARPQSSGARPVSVSRAGQRGQRTRTIGGRQQDKRRTKGGHDPATEPGHSKLFGENSFAGGACFPSIKPGVKTYPNLLRELNLVLLSPRLTRFTFGVGGVLGLSSEHRTCEASGVRGADGLSRPF